MARIVRGSDLKKIKNSRKIMIFRFFIIFILPQVWVSSASAAHEGHAVPGRWRVRAPGGTWGRPRAAQEVGRCVGSMGEAIRKTSFFENRDFLMIFGSWARLGLGIPPPGASEAQRHCGPVADTGDPAGGPRDPGRPPTLPAVSGVARGSLARVLGPLGGPWRAL